MTLTEAQIKFPTVSFGDDVQIGDDAQIGNSARIGDDARIGSYARIGNSARIGDDAQIGDGAWIGDDAQIGNSARIGDDAQIGDGARIGSYAQIGYRVVITKTPLQVQCNPYLVYPYSEDRVGVGCVIHKIEYWLRDALPDELANHPECQPWSLYRRAIELVVESMKGGL